MPQFTVPPEMEGKPLDPESMITIRGDQIPAFNKLIARQRGTRNNLLLRSWAGIGDQICAEPTIRWALEELKEYSISLSARTPELYQHLHLKLKLVHHLVKDEKLDMSRYFVVDLMSSGECLAHEFMCHFNMHCVDFPSVIGFRSQIPVGYKGIQLYPRDGDRERVNNALNDQIAGRFWVLIHPGSHWPAKTFPAAWWNEVILRIAEAGAVPVLMGATDTDEYGTRSTVDVDASRCLDLRGKLSIMESVALCQRAGTVLTNDSAPLHMAASGNARIGFISIAKHPDHLMHWRKGGFGWNMINLSRGGIWESGDLTLIDAAKIQRPDYDRLLPHPREVSHWALGFESRIVS